MDDIVAPENDSRCRLRHLTTGGDDIESPKLPKCHPDSRDAIDGFARGRINIEGCFRRGAERVDRAANKKRAGQAGAFQKLRSLCRLRLLPAAFAVAAAIGTRRTLGTWSALGARATFMPR